MLKTLGKTSWESIEVAEVYAVLRDNGKFDIEARHNIEVVDESIMLEGEGGFESGHFTSRPTSSQEIYKLPKSVQRLWITE